MPEPSQRPPARPNTTPPPPRPRPPAPAEASSPNEEFHQLATRLSKRLAAFEEFQAGRQGLVSAEVDFRSAERFHQLEWRRDGNSWRLWVWDVPTAEEAAEQFDPTTGGTPAYFNGRPLSQCSIEVMIAAASTLPKLIQAIRREEAQKLEQLRAAHAVLDKAALELGWKEGA